MTQALGITWIVLASTGVAVSLVGVRFSLSRMRTMNWSNGYDRDHPMRILAVSHLRHHIARGFGFSTWIVTGVLATMTPRPPVITIILRILLTASVVVFLADSITDVRVRQRLSRRLESGGYRSPEGGDDR